MLRLELGNDSFAITPWLGGGGALLSGEGVVILRLPGTLDRFFYQSI
jgi:hypothetical protein